MINRIFDAIKQNGFTQAYVCKLLGVSPSYLSNLKSGKVRITNDMIDQFSVALGVSADYLKYGIELTQDDKEKLKMFSDAYLENPHHPTENDRRTLQAAVDSGLMPQEIADNYFS